MVDELVGLQDLPVIVLNELGIAIPPTYIGDSLNNRKSVVIRWIQEIVSRR